MLILVPDRLPDSKGNEGVSWNWAKLNHSDLRWFDLNEKTISMDEPEILDPQNIESYGDNNQIIGIARGKLIQERMLYPYQQENGLGSLILDLIPCCQRIVIIEVFGLLEHVTTFLQLLDQKTQ